MTAEPLATRSRRSPALIGALLVLPLLLAGCSGTRFGEALSRSFSTPADPAAGATTEPAPGATTGPQQGQGAANSANPLATPAGTTSGAQAPGAAPETSPASGPTQASAPKGATPSQPTGSKTAVGSAAGTSPRSGSVDPARPTAPAPANPAPYRVTIRLPQADPSAPAEVVTEALRAAGVPFEVETIERMGGTSPPAPAVQPAAPQVRPAPPPR